MALLLLPLVLLPLVLLPVSPLAQPAEARTELPPEPERLLWGVWTGHEGGSFIPVHPSVHLCVQSAGPVWLRLETRGHPGYSFEPRPDAPDCRPVMGGLLLYVAEARGEVRVLVTHIPPIGLERPGAVRLPEAGQALVVPAGSARSEVTVERQPGVNVSAYAWPSLVPVFDLAGNGSVAPVGAGLVVLVSEGAAGMGVLRWSDPEWHDRAPRLGVVLAVVALALLVTLYRGTPGRSLLPLAPRRRR